MDLGRRLMPLCRACDAPVLFVPSAKTGATMILDAVPVAEGNVVIEGDAARVLTRVEAAAATLFAEKRYVSHFATCPRAADFRQGS